MQLSDGEAHADEHPGQQPVIRVGHHRAQRHRAGIRVHVHAGKIDGAGMRIGLSIGHQYVDASGVARPGGRLYALQFVGRLAEVHVNGIDLLDGRELGGFALAHQGPLGDQRPAGAPGDGRGHRGVAEVEPRGFNVGLSLLDGGGGAAGIGQGRVQILGRQQLFGVEAAIAFGSGRGVGRVGLGSGQRRLPGMERRHQRRRIDLEQHLSLFHVGAFGVGAFEHDARHPRPYLGDAGRSQPPHQRPRQRYCPGMGSDDAHLGWRPLPLGWRRRFAAGAEREDADAEQDTDQGCSHH